MYIHVVNIIISDVPLMCLYQHASLVPAGIYRPNAVATDKPKTFSFDYSYWSHTGVSERVSY